MIPVYQFHIPFSLRKYTFLSIGKVHQYTEEVEESKTKEPFSSLEKLVSRGNRMILILSGTFVEYLQSETPETINAIKNGIKNDQIILAGSTYHDSLASLYAPALFKEQIKMHQSILKEVFDYSSLIFYNTATLYFDKLAQVYDELGISAVIAPLSKWHLNGKPPHSVFQGKNNIKLILLGSDTLEDYQIGEIEERIFNSSHEESSASLYRVPQPIYNKRLVRGNTLSSNALQHAVHQKIIYLKKKLKKQKRTELYKALSLFTALDFFDMLTKTDDQSNREPYEHYTTLMNMLTDFEWVNKI